VRALILGASGFIGRYLADHLLESRNEVIGTYRFERLEPRKSFRTYRLNILDAGAISNLIRRFQPDSVYHLAGQSSVIESWTRPRETLETNIMGSVNVLEAMRKTRSKARVLLVSSSTVYGDAFKRERRVKEEEALQPKDPYSVSKASIDFLGRVYASNYGVDLVTVRLFNEIGPGQSRRFSLSSFAYQVVQMERRGGQRILSVGNIDARRDFTDIRDGVRAFRLALEKCKRGEAYNLASGRTYSLRDLLGKLISLSRIKSPVRIVKDPSLVPKDEIQEMKVDQTKFQRETGWRPIIPIGVTLQDMLDHWRVNGVGKAS
jgi:GDP-4-dehydro-6-deoxy-D-mannose reductase